MPISTEAIGCTWYINLLIKLPRRLRDLIMSKVDRSHTPISSSSGQRYLLSTTSASTRRAAWIWMIMYQWQWQMEKQTVPFLPQRKVVRGDEECESSMWIWHSQLLDWPTYFEAILLQKQGDYEVETSPLPKKTRKSWDLLNACR